MAGVFNVLEVQVSDESAFAEAVATYATHFPVLGAPRITFAHERIRDPANRSRSSAEGLSHLGPRSAMIEFTIYVPTHFNPTTGALTSTFSHKLLADGLGGNNTSQVGGTVGTVTDAKQWTLGGGAVAVAGGVQRVGAKGDGRGDGQPVVVDNAATATYLNALPAAPTTGDVIYSAMMAYHDESVASSLTTKRFLLGHTPSGCQYHFRGCQLAGVSFNYQLERMPTMTLTYQCAYYVEASFSIPSSTAIENHDCAPFEGGSMFINDFGTTTRNTIDAAEVNLSLELGLAAKNSTSGALYPDQVITGYTRTGCKPTLSVLIPWSTTYSTWWETINSSIARKHILLSLTTGTGGRDAGFYMPYVHPIGPRPTIDEWNSLVYQRVTFLGSESTTTSTELTRSAIRFYAG